MKNLAKNAGLLFIALGALCVTSCTKDDVVTPGGDKAVETTNVDFVVNAESNATGKMVDRNAAPLFVENLIIAASFGNMGTPNYYQTSETFTFGPAGAGVDSGFSLPNVALGSNVFMANSSPKQSDLRCTLGAVAGAAPSNVLDVMKAHTPYIPTFSQNVTAIIKKTDNAPVAITMKTDHGRILARFIQEAPDADNYYATVSATVADMDDMGVWTTKTLPAVAVTHTTGFEWSDNFAMHGQTATFTIKVYEKLANGNHGELLNTITKSVTVAKSTTKLCTYTLKNTDVETNIENGGIVLTFPTIGEEIIND